MTAFFEDHLNLDSLVAFVDGELSLTAYQRAAAHISRCPRCATEVSDQLFARDSLRAAPAPQMPGSLAASLFSIPLATPLAARTPGVGIDSNTGHAIRVSHTGREVTRSRRLRLGAGALVAGIAVGALASAAPSQLDEPTPAPGVRGNMEPASFSPSIAVPSVPNSPGAADASPGNARGSTPPTR